MSESFLSLEITNFKNVIATAPNCLIPDVCLQRREECSQICREGAPASEEGFNGCVHENVHSCSEQLPLQLQTLPWLYVLWQHLVEFG